MINERILWIVVTLGILVILALAITLVRKKRTSGGGKLNNQVYIGNLPYRISEYDIKNYFGQYGKISDIRIVKNSRTGRSRGYGFVTYTDVRAAQSALSSHGKELKGRKVVVRIAKPNKGM